MNVRQKLLAGYLAVALMVAATALIAGRASAVSAERATVTEAARLARGVGQDIAFGPPSADPDEAVSPLHYIQSAFTAYLRRLPEIHGRDVVVVDTAKYILGDAVPAIRSPRPA